MKRIEQEAKEFMADNKKTSDELTPEDKDAYRFYFELFFNSDGFMDQLAHQGLKIEDIVVRSIKREKSRLNVS